MLEGLKGSDQGTELLPAFQMLEGQFEGVGHGTEHFGTQAQRGSIDHGFEQSAPLARAPHPRPDRHAHSVELDRGGVA